MPFGNVSTVGSKNACLCSDQFVPNRLPQSDNFCIILIDDAMFHGILVPSRPCPATSKCKVPDRQLTLVLQLDVTGHCEASGFPLALPLAYRFQGRVV